MGAAGVVAAVPAVWRLAATPAAGNLAAGSPAGGAVVGDSIEWAVDHIFGTYPPYAHAIPYGRHIDGSPAALETGAFDPVLMI